MTDVTLQNNTTEDAALPEEPTTPAIPENYFLMAPANEAIIQGESHTLPPLGSRLVFIFGVPLIIIGIVLAWQAYARWQVIIPATQAGVAAPPDTIGNGLLWTVVALIFNLFVLGLYLSGLSVLERRWRLQRNGEIIWGEVIGASGKLDRFDDLRVTLEYRFKRPKRWRWSRQQIITDKVTDDRNDLHQKALPSPGTPVAVLYLSPQNYELL